MMRYLPTRSRNISPHRNDCAGYGSPASASNAATTARMPSASSRNREAVVTALGDHSTLSGRHRAAACAPARVRWRQAAQPLTTPCTPPRLPRSPHPPVPAEMPTAPTPAAAGTQLPEQQQQPHRPDESPHAGRRRWSAWSSVPRPNGHSGQRRSGLPLPAACAHSKLRPGWAFTEARNGACWGGRIAGPQAGSGSIVFGGGWAQNLVPKPACGTVASRRSWPRPSGRGCLDGRGRLCPVPSGRGVGERAAVDVFVPEGGRAVGQRGRCGDRGSVDQGLPVGVDRGAVGRVADVHPDRDPVGT